MLTSAEREAKRADMRRAIRDELVDLVREETGGADMVGRVRVLISAPDYVFASDDFRDQPEVKTLEEAHLYLDVMQEFFDYVSRFGEH